MHLTDVQLVATATEHLLRVAHHQFVVAEPLRDARRERYEQATAGLSALNTPDHRKPRRVRGVATYIQ